MKDLNAIVSVNAESHEPQLTITIPAKQLATIKKALDTATASLRDVLANGPSGYQRNNIRQVDLPIIERASKFVQGIQISAAIDALDKPPRGEDSPYAEDRAQARFDAIIAARAAAKAEEAQQEDEDENPPQLVLDCAVRPGDFLKAIRFSKTVVCLSITERSRTQSVNLYLDDIDILTRWILEMGEDSDELRLDCLSGSLDFVPCQLGDITDVEIRMNNSFVSASLTHQGIKDLLEFLCG